MSSKADFYDTLGVSRDADATALKKAYRKLAVQYHPDKNPGDDAAEAKFKEITEAYGVLSDEEKRAAYDRYGHDAFQGGGMGGGGFSSADAQDIFEQFFGGGGGSGGSIFGDLFGAQGGGGRGARANNGGSDLRYDMEIDFEESVFGSRRKITYSTNATCEDCNGAGGSGRIECPACKGSGYMITSNGLFRMKQACSSCRGSGNMLKDPCKTCRGEGRAKKKQTIELKIPAGVETGMRLHARGKGEAGRQGGAAGDLYVVIHVRKHDIFERDGEDLYAEVHVPFATAALGGEIQVPTLDGFAKLKLPSSTESGKLFRLRKQGLKSPRGHGQGDLHVKVIVEVPSKLSRAQKKLLEQFGAEMTESNHPKSVDLKRRTEEFFSRKKDLEEDREKAT